MRYIWAASRQNQQNDLCAQRRLRSAWESAQSDQSLRCPHERILGPQLPIERTAQALIRLGGCLGCSESLLGAQIILLVLSWGGPYCLDVYLILLVLGLAAVWDCGTPWNFHLNVCSFIVFENITVYHKRILSCSVTTSWQFHLADTKSHSHK